METIEKTKPKNTVDDFLGIKNHRYFGSGYKRISYSLKNYSFDSKNVKAQLKVNWPQKWSHKSGVETVPHIGSLEAFSISAQLCEIFFCTCCDFSLNQISKIWIREFVIKSGHRANANPSGEFDITATCLHTEAYNNSLNGFVTTFGIEIGSMKISLTFDHPEYKNKCVSVDKLLEVLNHNHQSYYTLGYRTHIQNLYDVDVDYDAGRIKSKVSLENQEINEALQSMGSYYQPCPTLVDAIIVSGQLIQILMYELDKLSRDETNNLWMREVRALYPKPMENNFFESYINLADWKKIDFNGQTWRMATVNSVIGNNEVVGSVRIAHIINR